MRIDVINLVKFTMSFSV